jgi:hypothetical protein
LQCISALGALDLIAWQLSEFLVLMCLYKFIFFAVPLGVLTSTISINLALSLFHAAVSELPLNYQSKIGTYFKHFKVCQRCDSVSIPSSIQDVVWYPIQQVAITNPMLVS